VKQGTGAHPWRRSGGGGRIWQTGGTGCGGAGQKAAQRGGGLILVVRDGRGSPWMARGGGSCQAERGTGEGPEECSSVATDVSGRRPNLRCCSRTWQPCHTKIRLGHAVQGPERAGIGVVIAVEKELHTATARMASWQFFTMA
jgi:hypothetical protein